MGGVRLAIGCDGSGAALEIGHMKAGKKLSVAFRRARIRRLSAETAKPSDTAPAKVPHLRLVVSNNTAPKR